MSGKRDILLTEDTLTKEEIKKLFQECENVEHIRNYLNPRTCYESSFQFILLEINM